MKKLFNFFNLFPFREKVFSVLLFFGAFVASSVEIISLGSVAGYIMVLSDPNLILDKLPNSSIKSFASGLEKNKFIIYSTVILIIIFAFKNFFLLFFNFINMWVEKNILVNLSRRLLVAYLDKPYLFHINNNPNILINTIISETNRATAFIFTLIGLLREIIVLVILFMSTILISYKLTILIGISLGISSLIFLYIIKNLLKKLGVKSKELSEERLKNLNETFGVIKILKLENAKNYFVERFEKAQSNKIKTENMLRFVTLIPRSFLETFGIVTIAITTFFFIFTGQNIDVIIPTLTLLGIILIRAIPAFGIINVSASVLQFHKESMKNIVKEFNKHFDLENKTKDKIKYNNNLKINSISTQNLEFQYPSSQLSVLKKISINIKKGEFVGIVGKSGSGKSTLIDIILGLLSPTSGKMKINDNPELNMVDHFEKKIGYIPQDIYLMDDTIENNIALGVNEKNIDKSKIIKLINQLKLESVIDQSEYGIKTKIGNRGIKLSGGQRQRIGIARALYKDPEIIILDEATNALDVETEKEIIKNINSIKKDKIIIMINHRTNMLNDCDQIYLMENGNLIKKNNLNELSSKYIIE